VSRPDPQLVPLHAGITAFYQPPGGWFVNNAGIVVGNAGALLVDTCASESMTRRLREAATSRIQPGLPLAVALTHCHGDHANGAGLLASEGANIMATPNAIPEIMSGPHTYDMLFDCSSWGAIAPPETIDPIDSPRRIDLGGTLVEILPVPGLAHTPGDLVVWHEQSRTLFAGDLLFNGVTPLAIAGSVHGWLEALRWLERFEARVYVPGHGPVSPAGAGLVDELRLYLRWLIDTTAQPEPPDYAELEREARALWPHWLAGERHILNARAAYAQTHGTELDFLAGAKDLLVSAAAHGVPMSQSGIIRLEL
jgi:cyclase